MKAWWFVKVDVLPVPLVEMRQYADHEPRNADVIEAFQFQKCFFFIDSLS